MWLTRLGDPETGALFLHNLRNGAFVTQWQARLSLLRDLQACDALKLLEGIPAPVREKCRLLRAPPPVAVDAGTP